MRITLMGTAAGGGFPQWNCNCRNCAGQRAGTVRARARTQSSIFIQPDHGNLAVANVHGHFETETHFGSFRLGPHGVSP